MQNKNEQHRLSNPDIATNQYAQKNCFLRVIFLHLAPVIFWLLFLLCHFFYRVLQEGYTLSIFHDLLISYGSYITITFTVAKLLEKITSIYCDAKNSQLLWWDFLRILLYLVLLVYIVNYFIK